MKLTILKLLKMTLKFSTYGFLFQVFFMSILMANNGNAQYKNTNEIIIKEAVTGHTVKEVFQLIEANSDFEIFYIQRDLKSKKEIHLKPESGRSVYDILIEISKQTGLKFRQVNNVISATPISIEELNADMKRVEVLADVDISGKVTDENGEGLPGATIVEKGTTIGTTTDMDGNYKLRVTEGASVAISFVGYMTQDIIVGAQRLIDVQMVLDATQLEELVVVGYGTQDRASVTGSIGQLKAKNIKDMPVTGFDQAIAGQIAGVQVVQGTGSPGTSASIKIRGVSTITAGTNPLLVVDGFPSSSLNIGDINPNDIESIEVLKDAASASIYGSRAGNGVILVTTKKGNSNGIEINFNVYSGVQKVAQTYDMANAYEWAEYQTEAYIADGSWATDGSDTPDLYKPYLAGTPGLTDTNWQDEIFHDASIQKYQISLSGGNEKTKFYVSSDIFDQEGVVLGSSFKRYSFRANVESNLLENAEAKFFKKVNFGINLAPTYSFNNKVSEDHHNGDGLIVALYLFPQFAPYSADGSYNISENIEFGFAPFENHVAVALERQNPVKRANLLSTSYLEFELIEGLNLKTSFGFNYSNDQDRLFRPGLLGKRFVPAPTIPTASSTTVNSLNWINENTLTYSKSINDVHNINLLAGYSYVTERIESTFLSGQGFSNDDVSTLNAASNITGGSSFEEEWALKSYFGRANYDYKGKYLVAASVRTDGSSRFGEISKWGVFPALSLGWRISEEVFFSGMQSLISDFKLRASIGRTGNDQIANYGAIARLGSANYNYGAGLSAGLTPISAPNANLSWETTDQIDFGLDIGLLRDKIFIVADYYKSTTDGMLLDVPVPSQSGYLTSLQNLGKVENKGFEFALGARDIKLGSVQWSASFNISTNRNKLLELGPGQEEIVTKFNKSEIGRPLGEFYVYNILGVYNTQQEIDASVHLSNATPGDYIWEDVNENGEIDGNDRKIVGNAFPDFTYGFSSTFKFKGLDLGVLIQGSEGAETINFTKFFVAAPGFWNNVTSDRVQGRWQSASNPGTGWSRSDVAGWQLDQSNYLVEDASYFRIRNITLGYTLPRVLTQKVKIEKARVYFSSQNPFISTNYTGYNPEATSRIGSQGSPLEPGIDWGNYPTAKTFTLGVNLTF